MKLLACLLTCFFAAAPAHHDPELASAHRAIKVAVLQLTPADGESESAVHRASARMLAAARLARDLDKDKLSVELSAFPCRANAASVRKAIQALVKAEFPAVLAPPHPALAQVARKTAQGKIACVAFESRETLLSEALGISARDQHCARRVAVVHDGKASKLLKAMQTLPYPCELVASIPASIKAKKFTKELASRRPDMFILDGDPTKLAKFTSGVFKDVKADVMLTPRAFGAELLTVLPRARILLGRKTPASESFAIAFDKAHAKQADKHPSRHFGVAEGHDALRLMMRAIEALGEDAITAKAIEKTLRTTTADGIHGQVRLDKKTRSIDLRLGLWNLSKAQLGSYIPVFASSGPITGGDSEKTNPDPALGDVFGTRRSHVFRALENTQWVHCRWAGGPRGTIDRDLAVLGLSTKGELPLLDRLVKDEIMSRILSIASTKFLRTVDGKAIPGKSFGITFTTKLPPKKLHKKLGCKGIWPASFGGDDAAAGGRAFGNRCEIYSSFIRRTIFDKHKLTPPIQPADIEYLDGSYVFGKDRKKNKRSELIRALINGFAGSMALTTAHEVGHLCGLEHITDDKSAIMDAAEGAGLHHDEAKFADRHVVLLGKRLGVAKTAK